MHRELDGRGSPEHLAVGSLWLLVSCIVDIAAEGDVEGVRLLAALVDVPGLGLVADIRLTWRAGEGGEGREDLYMVSVYTWYPFNVVVSMATEGGVVYLCSPPLSI